MSDQVLVGDSVSDGAVENQSAVSTEKERPISPAPTPQDFVSKKDFDNAVKELRGLQKRQDKSTDAQTRFMDELKTQIAKGLSFDEAAQAVNESAKARDKDDLLYQIAEKLGVGSSSQQAPAGNSSPVTIDKAKIIADNHLDGNDLDVVAQFVNVDFKSPLEAENAALKLALRRANPSQPDISAAPGMTGKPARAVENGDLIAELQKLQKTPTKNTKRMAEIEEKLGWK